MSLESIRVGVRGCCIGPLARIALLSALCLLQPALASAQLIISEFRLRGGQGATDEFIEIYNAGSNHTVAPFSGSGYGIAASDGVTRCSIPSGTVIPARRHYLCVNSANYSIGAYPAGNASTATGDATYTTDIPDNAGIALFNNNSGGGSYILANRMDAVGSTSEANTLYREGAGYPALTPFSIDYSFTRRPPGGCIGSGISPCTTPALHATMPGPTSAALQDTNNNAADFLFVDTNGTSAGSGQRLGAPGPENLSSPATLEGFALAASRADPSRAYNAVPNYVRVGGPWCADVGPPCDPATNSTFGRLDIRQKFTNSSGANITRLRFRVLDITTFPALTGVADLRPITSSDIVDPILGTVRGTTLEQPPSQPNGSGFNGTLSVGAVTLATPLPAGGRIDVRFVTGVQQPGNARFCVAAETVPAAASQVFCFIGPTEGIVVDRSVATFSNATAITIPQTGTGSVDGSQATPYPSNITVAGVTAPVSRITVTLKQFSHSFPDDVDVLLVGPTGVKFLLMSDAIGGADTTGQTYTFDDRAPSVLPRNSAPPLSGSVRPVNYEASDVFPGPAPPAPYLSPAPFGSDSLASAFGGLNPNGTWSLYVVDDFNTDAGAIAGGWELTFLSSCTAPLGAVKADFNGDCASDITVYRPSTGHWLSPGQSPVQFGLPGDYPVAGDYDGDGKIDRAVFRPATSEWFVQGQLTLSFGLPGDIAVPGDYNGDRATDRAVWRPATGQWFVHNQATVGWGLPGDIPVPADYDGDGATDRAVYRPSNGTWYVQNQGPLQFGLPGDIPVPGDYNGNGIAERAVFRPSTGQWFVFLQTTVQFGLPGDIPVQGDYNGDGMNDRAVFRPSTNQWFIDGQPMVMWGLPGDIPAVRPDAFGDFNGDGTMDAAGYLGDFDGNGTTDVTVFRPSTAEWFSPGQAAVQWGLIGDIPVPGDYDGNGATDRAVYRPANNIWFVQNQAPVQFGLAGDVVVPGDYDGNGTTDRAVFRPSTGQWFVHNQATVQFGLAGDVPVPGDYDGNGTTDRAVFRPSTSQWFVQGQAVVAFGLAGDIPVPADYDGNGTVDRAVYRPAIGQWFVQGQATVQWGLPGDIPVPGDYNGDGLKDRAVFRPSTGIWFIHNQFSIQWGLAGDFPASRAYAPRWP